MVGLERGTVELEPYRDEWADLYKKEVQRLKDITGNRFLGFEHIGSTAIEGMHAKPVIDIVALVEDLADAKGLIPVLEEHGYEHRPGDVEGRVFFAKGPCTNRTVYLSVTERECDFYKEKIAFRDYLREHSETAEKYASLKKRWAKQYPENREEYTAEKDEFVQEILGVALRE